jgi:hypothetical protein
MATLAEPVRTQPVLLLLPATGYPDDRLHHRFIGVIFARRDNCIGVMLHYVHVKLGVLVKPVVVAAGQDCRFNRILSSTQQLLTRNLRHIDHFSLRCRIRGQHERSA